MTHCILRPRPRPSLRRGIAMLLVLIGLAMATIVTTAYLASRDNSAVIGANVAAAAEARWAADAGLDLGVALLETESDWRTAHVNGALLANYTLGPASIDLDILDLETDAPPTEDTAVVQLISRATVDGVEQIAIAIARIQPNPEKEGVDVDLSEFAVFASNRLELKDDAIITRWTTAPKSQLGERIALGTRATSAGSIRFDNQSAAIDSTIYHGPSASGSLIANAASPNLEALELGDQIPLPEAPPVPVAAPSGGLLPSLLSVVPIAISIDKRYAKIEVPFLSSVVTLQNPITVVSNDDLKLKQDSGMLIEGDVTVVVFDDVIMERGSWIELANDTSRLQMFVVGDFHAYDAYIGTLRSDRTNADRTGSQPHFDPDRVQIYSNGSGTFRVEGTSVVSGNWYLPRSRFEITDSAALYGRLATKEAYLSRSAAIFYDPALNSGTGFTNPGSPVYDNDGKLVSSVSSLATLGDGDATALSTLLGLPVRVANILLGAPVDDGGGPTPPDEATPRPVPVEYALNTYGSSFDPWEASTVDALGSVGGGGTSGGDDDDD